MWLIDNIFRHHDGTLFNYIKEIRTTEDVVIVRLKGKIDSDTIPIIMANRSEKYLAHVTENHILFDLKEVKHVDSATLASLILLLHDLKLHHKKLAFVNIPPRIRDYVDIVRLSYYVHEYENEEAALAALNNGNENEY